MIYFFNKLKLSRYISVVAWLLCVSMGIPSLCFGGVISDVSIVSVKTFMDYNTSNSYSGGPGYNFNYNYTDYLSINLGYRGSGSALAFCTVSAGSGGSYTNRQATCPGQANLSYRIYNAPQSWTIRYDALDRPPATASEWNNVMRFDFTQPSYWTQSYGVLVYGGQHRTPGSVFTDQVTLTVWFMGTSGPVRMGDYPITIRIQIYRPPNSISVNSGNSLLSLNTITPRQQVPVSLTYTYYGGYRLLFSTQRGGMTHQNASVVSKLPYRLVSTSSPSPFSIDINGGAASSLLTSNVLSANGSVTIAANFVMPDSIATMVSGTYSDLVTFSLEEL